MEENFNKHLGNKLKLRRLALGLTQTKVAKAINVTFQQIQKCTETNEYFLKKHQSSPQRQASKGGGVWVPPKNTTCSTCSTPHGLLVTVSWVRSMGEIRFSWYPRILQRHQRSPAAVPLKEVSVKLG